MGLRKRDGSKTEAEQLAFDQSSQFATRPGDQAWKAQITASLEQASLGTGSYQRWDREIIRTLRNATGVHEINGRLTWEANPTKDVRQKFLDRLIWLIEAGEQYGGLHMPAGRELEYRTRVIATPGWMSE